MEENTIYIGKKDLISYIYAVVLQLENHKEVTLKARGRLISKAVDVAEIVKSRLGAKVKKSFGKLRESSKR